MVDSSSGLQELTLGSKPLLICGHHCLNFGDVAQFVGKAVLVLHDTYTARSVGAFMKHFSSYSRSRVILTPGPQRFTWKDFYVVCELQHHACSNPRDRAYAILSLIPFQTAYFEPNYGLEVNQVFTDMARVVMEEKWRPSCHLSCL